MPLMPKELFLLVKLTGIEEVADKAEAQKFLDSQAEIGRRIGLLLRRFGVRATKVEVAIGPHPDMDINSFLHALQYDLEALVVAWRRKAETSKTCGALSAVGALLAQGLGFLQGAVTTREVHDALKRRCLHLHIGFPTPALELQVLRARVPGLNDQLLRQLVAQHLVEVDYDRYNVLQLTEASRAVLRGERRIELRVQVAEPRRRAKGRRVYHRLLSRVWIRCS
jgi:hypothetical protein